VNTALLKEGKTHTHTQEIIYQQVISNQHKVKGDMTK